MQADKPLTVAAATALSTLGILGILAAPIFQNVLQVGLGLDADQSALVVGAEVGGVALASLLAPVWITRARLRNTAFLAVVVLIAINAVSAYQTNGTLLMALRFFAGLIGGGTAYAVAIAVITHYTSNHDRNFGFAVAAQAATGVLSFLVLPALAERYGVRGVLLPMAVFALLILPLVVGIPAGKSGDATASSGAGSGPAAAAPAGGILPAVAALLILLIWTTGLGGIWTFIFTIGNNGGLTAIETGNAIAISTTMAVGGGLTASALAGRGGRLLPVSIAMLIQIGAIMLLKGEMGFARFALTAIVFQYFWNFTGPYLMGTVASHDSSGRISVLMPAALTGGFSLGPIIAGSMMTGDSLLPANYVAIVCIVLALILFNLLGLRQRSSAPPVGTA